MKHTLIIIILAIFMFSSCKSHKNVSRSVVDNTRAESLVTINDSTVTHLETSHKTDASKSEEHTEYSRRTEFGTDSNVVSITETIIVFNARFDFKSQLDKIQREDFKLFSTTLSTDATSNTLNEKLKEKQDSRPIQGWEWAAVVFAFVVVLSFIVIIVKNRIRI